MTERPTRLLFVTLTNDVGTDRIVSAMGRAGADCAVIGHRSSFAALCSDVNAVHALPSPGGAFAAAWFARRRLEEVVPAWRPDAVIPLDDLAASLLRGLATDPRTSSGLREALVASFGAPEGYDAAVSRETLIEVAGRLGLRIPAHRSAPDLDPALAAADELGYPVVLKRDQTCGGSGVAIAADREALRTAFGQARRKASVKRLLRRRFGLPAVERGAPLSMQAFVRGTLAMRTVACAQGRVLEGVSFEAERLHPAAVGSSTVIHPIDNAQMDTAARLLVAHLGCSGFVSFDFMLARDGDAFLIEMNPRPVGSGHLGPMFGHDLYGAFLAHHRGVCLPARTRTTPHRSVALFPKELDRDPSSCVFDAGSGILHDVPADEPRVVEAYVERLVRTHPDQAAAIRQRVAACVARGPVVASREGAKPEIDRNDSSNLRLGVLS